jgi:hypothetical protein
MELLTFKKPVGTTLETNEGPTFKIAHVTSNDQYDLKMKPAVSMAA